MPDLGDFVGLAGAEKWDGFEVHVIEDTREADDKGHIPISTPRQKTSTSDLAAKEKVALNPLSDAPAVRTFSYSRGPQKEILFVNTDAKNSARVTIVENGLTDVFSAQKIAPGALEIPAGHYRLLRKNAGR